MFGVTILGNNSALPAYNRHPTAQIVTLNDHLFLVDCGEGTQMQMNLYKIRRSRINHIFISHLHGDHYFGLPGLITSYGLLGRLHELNLYAPAALQDILALQLNVSDTKLPYKLHFHALEKSTSLIIDEETFAVEAFEVVHRIDCWGFLFREKKKPRRINIEAVKKHNVPVEFFERLKRGEDFIDGDTVIPNEVLTTASKPVKSYAYSADTLYMESLAEKFRNVNMLYHEATYLKDKMEKAKTRFHSTSEQAASIAKLANAKKLLLGHFSSTYETLDEFLQEAREVFANTQLALEGQTYLVS